MLCSLFSYLFLTNVDFRASFFDCFPFMNFVPAFLYLQMIFDIQAVVLALMFFYRTDAVVGSNLWQDSPYTLGCVVKHTCFTIFLLSQNLSQAFCETLTRTFLNIEFLRTQTTVE